MKTIYNWIKRPLVLIILIIIIFLLFRRMHFFTGIFSSKPLLIDNTPLVIKEIKTIAELNTATLQQDIVVDSVAPAAIFIAAKREIVLIIKGKVTAGIDLQQLKEEDIFVKEDSVHVFLPKATIREIIINPSGIETFYEFGKWSNEEITLLKLSARGRLLQAASEHKLIDKADVKARAVITDFLKAAQFNKVVVETRK